MIHKNVALSASKDQIAARQKDRWETPTITILSAKSTRGGRIPTYYESQYNTVDTQHGTRS